jgi:hypothetical protein
VAPPVAGPAWEYPHSRRHKGIDWEEPTPQNR